MASLSRQATTRPSESLGTALNRIDRQMTEFATNLRRRCRNPKCRLKLPEPVSNEREAFCCRGCYRSFYRHRCLICEQPMERKTERQREARSIAAREEGIMNVHVPLRWPVLKASRLLEFCSQKELVLQTGHSVDQWPLVLVKVLFDNALDAAEEAGTAPAVGTTPNGLSD